MDPTANLKEQLAMAEDFLAWFDSDPTSQPEPAEAVRLAELVLALHQWIKGGGFLPAQWKS